MPMATTVVRIVHNWVTLESDLPSYKTYATQSRQLDQGAANYHPKARMRRY